MNNVYSQLACNILSKNQNPSYKERSPVYSGHYVNLPQVTTIDRFDCITKDCTSLCLNIICNR